MQNARDPLINQMCQVGLTNTDSYSNLFNSYGSIFATQYAKLKTNTRRRRRQSSNYIFTCTDLTNMGSGVVGLTSSQLSSISLADFYSCQTLLGQSSNSWSSSQLAVLASLAKSVFLNFI
jgi:hypothetical protein